MKIDETVDACRLGRRDLQLVAARTAEAPDAEAKYQAMLAAAKAAPAATDWQALRFAHADQPSFSLFAANDGRRAIDAAHTGRGG